MMKPPVSFSCLHLLLFLTIISLSATAVAGGGQWQLLQRSIGVSAMHMQLLHNDRVAIFDRTDFGTSNLSLPGGKCRHDPTERVLKIDCSAHSVEYSVADNTFRPLMILTDTWCSSGTVSPDGTLVQTGGFSDGELVVRTFSPCDDGKCDWSEKPASLAVRRWYATNQILPDGRAIVIGGRRVFSYEFYPKSGQSNSKAIPFRFLLETKDQDENNLYPFVHLNIDGNLFIFANNRAILFDYTKNTVVRTYPAMPGGDPRSYPSSASSVLLPLQPSGTETEVLVCGGAPNGSFRQAMGKVAFVRALSTCGRLRITDDAPSWSMETMPTARVMGDMVLLPTGDGVLIINGAANGTAGWECGKEPVMTPVVYQLNNPSGDRFEVQSTTTIPRLYHSTAILLRDGRVLVGGSNPHIYYNFSNVEFQTELSLEAFSPDYLSATNSGSRPRIITSSATSLSYGVQFKLRFSAGRISDGGVTVTMVAPAFTTHSFSMNQRLLILDTGKPVAVAGVSTSAYEVTVVAPKNSFMAPPGFYMVFAVNGGVPSEGIWVHIQ